MSTTNYALRVLPKNYRIRIPSSYVPITNTAHSKQIKQCLYKSKIYPGLMIPCPSSRYRIPPYRHRQQENEEEYEYEQVDDGNFGSKEKIKDKNEYDYNENQNQDEYDEENQQPLNAEEEFEHLASRVKCKTKKCIKDNNNKYENEREENESQDNGSQENESQDNGSQENEDESQEETPVSKEDEPISKPKPTPRPQGVNPKLKPLAIIHNYQPANFTKIINKNKDGVPDKYTSNEDIEEEEEEEDSQESRLEDVEEYNEGDDLQDDEYYYDDEEEYDQIPKKPKLPHKLTNIDNMKFKVEGDEPSESIYKNTVLKNISNTNNVYKAQMTQVNTTAQRPKPYDSAAEAYTRIKDKNKHQDQQVMQMAVHETTVAFNLIDERQNNHKLPTKTDSTTISVKYRPRPTIRPNILKR